MTRFRRGSPEGKPCRWQGFEIKLLDGYNGGNLIQKPYNKWTKKELVAVATQFPCRQARVFLFLLHLAGLLICPQHYLRKKDRVWRSFIEGSAQ